MKQPETRRSLIVRLQGERNELAWEEFVSTYEPFLRRLVQRHGVPPRHVADVVQQVLLAISRSVEGWEDDGRADSFRRWLNRVARNVVIRFMSRERRQPGGAGGTDLLTILETVPAEPDQEQIRQYEHELVIWAADQVQDEFRHSSWQAFQATLIDNRPVSEVAEELNVSPGSIYMSRSRIMARIRALIREVLDE